MILKKSLRIMRYNFLSSFIRERKALHLVPKEVTQFILQPKCSNKNQTKLRLSRV